MAHIPVLCVQLTIMVVSLLFNGFGIFTIQQRQEGNRNHHMLLQNLAAVEIVKTLYDFVPLLLYYFYIICDVSWYNTAIHYFVVMEVNVMTTIYVSFVAVTLDRLLCVVLGMKYSSYVTKKCVKIGIAFTWICTTFPGFIIWAIYPHPEISKKYYYLGWDIIVLLLIIPTYAIVFNILRNNRHRSRFSFITSNNSNRHYQPIFVGVLLALSFLIFNLVPDVVSLFSTNHTVFYIVSLLWSTGYLVDPLVYIFVSKESRRVNRRSLSEITTRINERFSVLFSVSKSGTDHRALIVRNGRPAVENSTHSLESIPGPPSHLRVDPLYEGMDVQTLELV